MVLTITFLYPRRHVLSHALLEGIAESGVVAVAAVLGQFPDGAPLLSSDGLAVEADEMVDAQTVDVGIVGGSLPREILAEIVAVGANSRGELVDGQVVLQVELSVYAMPL